VIVVRIELWPGGSERRKREIGRMTLANQGFGVHPDHPRRGNYDVSLMRRGTTDRVQRECEVLDYPRESYPVWELVRRALETLFRR